MFKVLLVLSVIAFAYGAPGVVVSPVVPVVHQPVVQHHGAHAVHSHVIHHPVPVKHVIAPAVIAKPAVIAVKPVVPLVPIVKPIVPLVPVHHAHPAVLVHH